MAHRDPAGHGQGAGAVDHDYVQRYTLGFEELKARAAEYPPDKVATGTPAGDIRTLAREYDGACRTRGLT